MVIVDKYLSSNNLPTPSFDVMGPPNIPISRDEKEVLAAQDLVIASTLELHDLMRGPVDILVGLAVSSAPIRLLIEGLVSYMHT